MTLTNNDKTALQRLNAFLEDESQFVRKSQCFTSDGIFPFNGVRKHFTTTNGITVSIQQSDGHYVSHYNEVEMFSCPHHEILSPYGDGAEPYCHVPISVCAAYINALETST